MSDELEQLRAENLLLRSKKLMLTGLILAARDAYEKDPNGYEMWELMDKLENSLKELF
jgi:hypothetical protein